MKSSISGKVEVYSFEKGTFDFIEVSLTRKTLDLSLQINLVDISSIEFADDFSLNISLASGITHILRAETNNKRNEWYLEISKFSNLARENFLIEEAEQYIQDFEEKGNS